MFPAFVAIKFYERQKKPKNKFGNTPNLVHFYITLKNKAGGNWVNSAKRL
jgi:hypothetical protein